MVPMLLDIPVDALLDRGVWTLPAHPTSMIGPCLSTGITGSAGTLFPFCHKGYANCCLVVAGSDSPLSRIVPTTLSLYHRGVC